MRLWTALAKQALGKNQVRQLTTTSRVMSKRLEGKVAIVTASSQG